ncbi:unnamed protein product [Kuraishia capsulata CBS 1993]|uniref:Major facilitator superfamily (MFS) profile domain-containing protein n=1 Tax=Kuraishia capsulata CBS 1993 TaxID=1382522 RepID=W6MIV7_9ASCO|nr:uncharacterized protein KUCA_T00001849001 [Kuraishia capsulata CBS 1993]CDK25878.1 unnamed protein product [Kuraishia capsulata CBS 1993]
MSSEEKRSPAASSNEEIQEEFHSDVPARWYDKRLVPFLPAYSTATVQIVMVSFVCFMCPGMFNALSGLGGAGLSDPTLSDNANVALYCTFATLGFFSGTICNWIGVPATLAFGGSGYAIYVASLFCYHYTENSGFVLFAGAWLGITAACLWGAQGTILMSYPDEKMKGRMFGMFWTIFNLGGVIGSCIPLAQNIHSKGSSVNVGTYAAFLALTIIGAILAFFLLPVRAVKRSDGSRIIAQKYPSLKTELLELLHILVKEPWIMLLFPMFFSSNWFNSYQMSDFNAGRFNIRTRSLNSLLYWFMQMVGSTCIGFILDLPYFSRKVRARYGWGIVFCITMLIWGLGYLFERTYTRTSVLDMTPIDFKDGAYIGPMFLYMFYGFYDAVWQTFSYWTMGALTNSSRKAAVYAGFYKGMQSAGAAIAWRLDSLNKPYRTMWASSWGILCGSLVFAIPVIFFRIKETTDLESDLLESDETLADIKPITSAVSSSHLGLANA